MLAISVNVLLGEVLVVLYSLREMTMGKWCWSRPQVTVSSLVSCGVMALGEAVRRI